LGLCENTAIAVSIKLWVIPPFCWSFFSLSPSLCHVLFLSRNLLILLCGHAIPISMASVYNPTIADSSSYEPTFKLDFQRLKSPAPSDAIALGCAARFNLSALDQAVMMDLSADTEISDSDDDSFPSVREILARLKQKEVIDLTTDDDDPVVAALDVGTDSLVSSSANLEPPSKESRAPITEPLNEPAVHDTPLVTPPRRSPFKNRPPWAIRSLQMRQRLRLIDMKFQCVTQETHRTPRSPTLPYRRLQIASTAVPSTM
jgi:hypothetical protein